MDRPPEDKPPEDKPPDGLPPEGLPESYAGSHAEVSRSKNQDPTCAPTSMHGITALVHHLHHLHHHYGLTCPVGDDDGGVDNEDDGDSSEDEFWDEQLQRGMNAFDPWFNDDEECRLPFGRWVNDF